MNAVEMHGISKEFPGVKALDNVDFSINKGEIHALLGENGAGKSTLMKVLYGMHQPNMGTISIKGKDVRINSPIEAIKLGIGMVHQHFMLVPVLTIAENIVAGAEPKNGLFFDLHKAISEVDKLAKDVGFTIDPRKKVEELSVGERQRIEILKALYRGVEILILDEPTAVLTPLEVKELFTTLRQLKQKGMSIILITHKLHEIMEVSDKVTVLRDGKTIGTVLPKDTSANELANMMVGREVKMGVKCRSTNVGDKLFEVQNLCLKNGDRFCLKDINLYLRKGEILGIAGVEGNGQTELIEVLTGLRKPDKMCLKIGEHEISNNAGADEFIKSGIGHIPEDRGERGLVLDMSIKNNCILGYHRINRFIKKGIFLNNVIGKYARHLIKTFKIKAVNEEIHVGTLSGGNQQKVIIGRIFAQNPEVVIAAQPTRGVDVGAIEYIHHKMIEFRDEGKAILLISADLDEIKSLSDRIVILYKGCVVAQGVTDDFTDTDLGILMTGGKISNEER